MYFLKHELRERISETSECQEKNDSNAKEGQALPH